MIIRHVETITKQNFYVPIDHYFLLAHLQYNKFFESVIKQLHLMPAYVRIEKIMGECEERIYYIDRYMGKITTEYKDNTITYKFVKA